MARSRGSAGAIFLVATVASFGGQLFTASPKAYATVPPFAFCRFSGTNPTLVASVSSPTTGDFNYAAVDAMNWWNRSAARVSIVHASNRANIRIQQQSVGADYWAVTETSDCNPGGRWPTTRIITLNDATMGSLTTRQKRIVIDHELGHAVGLGHVTAFSCSNASMMIQGEDKFGCASDPPWPDDARSINNIYARP